MYACLFVAFIFYVLRSPAHDLSLKEANQVAS